MNELILKYGCNPNQKPARLYRKSGEALPLTILNGMPGYINFMDALNAWPLVKELKQALNLPAAASFKHVSPAGAAVGLPLSPTLQKAYFTQDIENLNDSPLACAYVRARGADRLSSFGDWIALSDVCDRTTALCIAREVSDGIIAPGYTEEALSILKAKRKGSYAILQVDEHYEAPQMETREIFGLTLEQVHNHCRIDESLLLNIVTEKKDLPKAAQSDLLLSLITLKYTQSNSVCFAKDGQVIGNGAGQQSRVHCTRLAASKADLWFLRQHPLVLSLPFKEEVKRPERDNAIDCYLSSDAQEIFSGNRWESLFLSCPEFLSPDEKKRWIKSISGGTALGSDAFFPFADNIERAYQSGVSYIAQPGGSVRDDLVIKACDELGITMAMTGLRLFHH